MNLENFEKIESYTTKVNYANKKTNTLKSSIPKDIAELKDLKAGDSVQYSVYQNKQTGEVIIIYDEAKTLKEQLKTKKQVNIENNSYNNSNEDNNNTLSEQEQYDNIVNYAKKEYNEEISYNEELSITANIHFAEEMLKNYGATENDIILLKEGQIS